MGEVQAGLDIGSAGKQAGQMASDISSKFEEPAKKPTKDVSPSALKQDLLKKGGTGTAPDTKIRSQLAGPLGADIGGAKIHTGPAAATAAQGLQASAFTIGQDMFFGPGQYDPATPQGMALIAHEATHVLQQSGAKGDKTRFNTPRGGDEMEQEAQDVAQLVLSDLGKGESLHVKQYVRNYTSEGGDPVNPTDRNRLDAISLKALKYAQREIRLRRIGRTFPCDELVVDISLDLSEGSDTLLIKEWGEAIVDAVVALRVPGSAPEVAVQRDPKPDPAAKANDKETIDVSIASLSPTIADSSMVLSQDPAAMVSQILGMSTFTAGGKGNIRVFSAIIRDYLDVKEFDKSKAYLRTSHLQITFKKQAEGNADAFNKLAPPFRNAAQTVKGQVDAFLKEYMEQGKTAFLKLTEVARKQVHNKLVEYGFSSDPSLIKDPGSYKFMGGNDTSKKIAEKAKELMPLRKKVEENKEAAENLNSWWHRNTSRESTLKADEIKAKALPQAEADWHRALGAASATYPILSHYQTFDKLEELASNKNPNEVILKQLVEILVNLDTLDDKAKNDPGKIVYDLPSARAEAKKAFPEPWKGAYVDMVAEDRGDADTGWKTLLGAIAAALSLATGGAAGVGLLALRAAGAVISVAGLYSGIQDYRLADAAHMSDMDIAKSLSADEPSLFWLVFEVVTTVIGLKGDLVAMKETIAEIRTAYKVAQASGDTAALSKILIVRKVPPSTIKLILEQAMGASIAVVNFIRNPDPMTALGLIQSFHGFGNLRSAVLRTKEPPATITKAKLTLQEARVKAVQSAIDQAKVKYPLVKFEIATGGFESPIVIRIGATDIPIKPGAGGTPPAAVTAGGGGGGAPPSGPPSAGPPSSGAPSSGPKSVIPPSSTAVPPSSTAVAPGATPVVAPSESVLFQIAQSMKAKKSGTGTPDLGSAKTVPAAGGTGASPNAGSVPAPDPASPKAGSVASPAAGSVKVPPGAEQAAKAASELSSSDPGAGGNLGKSTDSDLSLDHTIVPFVEHMTPELRTILALKGLTKPPEYVGIVGRLDSKRFKVDQGFTAKLSGKGTSGIEVLKDSFVGPGGAKLSSESPLFIFKPAAKEAWMLHPDYKADWGTYYQRGKLASHIAEELPTIGESLSKTAIVVHDGRVGSIQKFIPNTESVSDYSARDAKAANDLWNSPEATKFKNNLRVYDHIINNPDRHTGNILIQWDDKGNFIKFVAIDQDLALTPGARTILRQRDELGQPIKPKEAVPTKQAGPGPDQPKAFGKITRSMYDQMVQMQVNKQDIKESMVNIYGADPATAEGVFTRLKESLEDFNNRLKTGNESDVFLD